MHVKHFEENTLGKDYVVGDIHGCFGKLQSALWLMGFNEAVDRLFSVGDLVDRGPESEEALDWLAKPWFHAVRGNHEQMAIDYVELGVAPYYAENGGKWMMDLKPSHRKLFAEAFNELPFVIDVQARGKLYGIVHADVVYNDWNTLVEAMNGPNAESTATAVMWDRRRHQFQDKSAVKNVELVYVGHTPLKDGVLKLGNVVYIDTGAVFKNGSLTIIELSKESV
jgi:serine/threonine protein phosphatase 1